MSVVKESVVSKNLVWERVFFGRSKRERNAHRGSRREPTAESVRIQYERRCVNRLMCLIDNNFNEGDYFVTFTFRDGARPRSKTQAERILSNLLARLGRLYRRHDIEFRRINWFEYGRHGNVHFHMTIPGGVLMEEIQRVWKRFGNVKIVTMYREGNFRGLAAYAMKETCGSFRPEMDRDMKGYRGMKRYRCSQNIVPPVILRAEAARADIEDPKPRKGYLIDKDTVYEGICLGTGARYVEYVMVRDDPAARYRRSRAARRVTKQMTTGEIAWLKEHGFYQMEFDLDFFGGVDSG